LCNSTKRQSPRVGTQQGIFWLGCAASIWKESFNNLLQKNDNPLNICVLSLF
jgi:hypothetical protein